MTRFRMPALLALVSVCFGGIAPAQAQGQAQDKCSINPNLCITEPMASPCPGSYKWSLADTGVAHCVLKTAPPAPLPPPPPPPPPPPAPMPCTSIGGSEAGSCQPGYSGSATRATSTNSCTGGITYDAWDYSACTIAACTSTSSTELAACQAPYTGQRTRTVTVNSCTGTTYSAWDITACLVPQTCSGGRTWDGTSCVCATGTWNGTSCVADCQAEDWAGSFTSSYQTKKGQVLAVPNGSPSIFVGCYGPDFIGKSGQTAPMACGYEYAEDGQSPPSGPPPTGGFVQENVRSSKCVGGAWTR